MQVEVGPANFAAESRLLEAAERRCRVVPS